MKRNPQLFYAIFTVAWILVWIILAVVDLHTHFIGIF